MKRWLRLGLQTAFGLFLLWLWLRTVSLPEVASHARVQSWPAVVLMIALFLVTSVIRARRWFASFASAGARGHGASIRHERSRRIAQLCDPDPIR